MPDEPQFITLRLLDDGTSDLLLDDADGVGLPEPYDPAVVRSALDRISRAVDGYRERMVSDASTG